MPDINTVVVTPTVSVVQVNSAVPGSYLSAPRLGFGIFSVRDPLYGAVGDGVTDDTVAIQAAIDAAVAVGGIVLFPETGSFYKVTAGLTVTGPCALYGPGEVQTADAAVVVFTVTGSGDVALRGLNITGPSTHTSAQSTGTGVKFLGTSAAAPMANVVVEGCVISGFSLWGVRLEFVRQFRLTGNFVSECVNTGLAHRSCWDGAVVDNDIEEIGDTTNTYGIYFSRTETDSIVTDPPSSDIVCANNRVRYVREWEGLDTHGGVRISFVDNVVTGCYVGIAVVDSDDASQVGAWPSVDVLVQGNVIDSLVTDGSASSGISVSGASTTVRTTGSLVGNVIRNHGPESSSTGGTGAVRLSNTQGMVVEGNVVWSPSPLGFAITSSNVDFVLRGNVVVDAWSDLSTVTGFCVVSGTNNTGTIEGNRISRGDKSAVRVNTYGVRLSGASGNVLSFGYNAFESATNPYTNAATTQQILGPGSINSASPGDADVTLTVGVSSQVQIFSTTLTANRTVTLATTPIYDGAAFEIIRSGLGEFTLDVGGLITLPPGQPSAVRVVYRSGAWRVASYTLLAPPAAWAAKTGDYTVTNNVDGLFLGGTTHTLTLQSAATRFRPLVLRNTASGTWTITRAGSDTVEGGTSINLLTGTYITLMPNGTNWLIVA